jgi:outer membrane protein TolC
MSISKPVISSIIRHVLLIAYAPAFLAGCGFQQYIAKPITPETISAKLQSKNIHNEAFQQYLIHNGYSKAQLPIQQWGIDELTYCALFFHPSLDLARAQWRSAVASQASASAKPLPSFNTHYARGNNANKDIRPFSYDFGIDIPFETANKRDFRIENATHLTEVAKLEIAQRAWSLRNQVALSLHAYQLNEKQLAILLNEQALKKEIVAIFQKRLDLGASSIAELSNAKLQLQATSAELNTLQQKKRLLRTNLANHTGLPLHIVETMELMPTENSVLTSNTESLSEAEKVALLNRIDIRIALERYAAAEAKLKLEIAKQYPNITVSPAYIYEFGNKVWSLGLSGLMTILTKNKIAIAEVTQLREVEAAQFEALQNTVISEVNSAYARVAQAQLIVEEQKKLHIMQKSNTQRIGKRLAAGETDRLELTYAKLEESLAEKNVVNANFELHGALIQFEHVRQMPLNKKMSGSKLEELAAKDE